MKTIEEDLEQDRIEHQVILEEEKKNKEIVNNKNDNLENAIVDLQEKIKVFYHF